MGWYGDGGGHNSDVTDLEVGELDRKLGVLRHPRDDKLHLPGVGAESVTNVNADPLDHNIYETFNLGVKVSPKKKVVETKSKGLT